MCRGPQGGCVNLLFRRHEGHGSHGAAWANALAAAVPRPLVASAGVVRLRYAGAPLDAAILADLLPRGRAWKLELSDPPRGAARDDIYAVALHPTAAGAVAGTTAGAMASSGRARLGRRTLELRRLEGSDGDAWAGATVNTTVNSSTTVNTTVSTIASTTTWA